VSWRWTEEATTLNETEPTLKQIKLVNHELSGYSKVSNTLLADAQAVGLDALLMQLFSRAIAWYEDYAFLRGNGVGKPLGVLSWNGLISVTAAVLPTPAAWPMSQVCMADCYRVQGDQTLCGRFILLC
jgi:HK97 family phage major capsid protein